MSKTVLHILNTDSFSGAENVVISIICGFRKCSGNDIHFVYVSLDGSIRQVLQEQNIEFAPVKKLTVGELKRVIREYEPDILHAHDFTASIICAAASSKIPVISHIHNNSPWIRTCCRNSIVYGLSCLRYNKMLGVSESVFDEFVFGKYFRKKEEIIGNPIDIAGIREKAFHAEDKTPYDVVFLGRLSAPKNPCFFLEIVREVCKVKRVRAVMIGDGKLRSEVEQKIEEYGLQDVVDMKGFMKNPYGILANSKMLCLPSKWEGFGLAAVEALALGKPVAASPVGGIPSIIQGEEGCLCSTAKEFSQEIIDMLNDTELYDKRVKMAGERAGQLDNMKKYIKKIDEIYNG